jgi:ribosomal protein S27AE
MAVVKARYVQRGRGERGRAKATIRYIQHRPGKEGERITRTLFGPDGEMTRAAAYRMIDQALRGSLFYRVVLSPDPNKEDRLKDLDLREITEQTMMQLHDIFPGAAIQFVAAIHADHTPKRHVHLLAVLPKRLVRDNLQTLRQAATEAALAKRQELDQSQEHTRRHLPKRSGSRRQRTEQGERTTGSARRNPLCPNCGPGSEMDRHGRFYECPNCGITVSRSLGLGLEIKRDADTGLELSLEEEETL